MDLLSVHLCRRRLFHPWFRLIYSPRARSRGGGGGESGLRFDTEKQGDDSSVSLGLVVDSTLLL